MLKHIYYSYVVGTIFLDVKAISDRMGYDWQRPMLALTEEVGETAHAIHVNKLGKKKPLDEDEKSECVDVILCALDLYFKLGGTPKHFSEISERKMVKWQKMHSATE